MTTAAALKETSAPEAMPEPLERTLMSHTPPPPPAPPPMLRPGDVLGSYEVTDFLGRGGMGEVYAATHSRLGRKAALKVLRTVHASRADLVERFFQEARTVNAINHEHIVEVYDFVEERMEGQPPRVYLVMELLSGQPLSEAMRTAPLPLRTVVGVARQVAEALAASHRVGVVHRDVKPDNVFITHRNGQPDYVKVLDFGVAKLEQRPQSVTPDTLEGMIIGTPAYMSPEQASAVGTDARSDIYSLGTMVYELLCGRIPFDAQNFVQLAMQVVATPVPPLPERSVSGEEIPPALRELVMACLSKDPAHRPSGMDEVAATLAVLGQTLKEPRAGAPRRPGPSPTVWLGAVAGLLGAAAAGAWFVQTGEAPEPLPDTAQLAPVVPVPLAPPPPTPLLVPQPEALGATRAADGQGDGAAAEIAGGDAVPSTVSGDGDGPATRRAVPVRARVKRVAEPRARELSKDALLDPYAD